MVRGNLLSDEHYRRNETAKLTAVYALKQAWVNHFRGGTGRWIF